MRLRNSGYRKIAKEIVKVTRVNKSKKVKIRCELKLIIFIYYLKLFFILNHTIELLY